MMIIDGKPPFFIEADTNQASRSKDLMKDKILIETIAEKALTGIASGSELFGTFFIARDRISKNRIYNFVNEFFDYMCELGIKINSNGIADETFSDIFYAILRNVTSTKSQKKIKIYKDILARNYVNPVQYDFLEAFLDLVNKLDSIEIEILIKYANTGHSGSMDPKPDAAGCVSDLTFANYREEIKKIIQKQSPKFETVQVEGRYEFYICDLISKSILVDKMSTGNYFGASGFEYLYITDFGKDFLEFIEEYKA